MWEVIGFEKDVKPDGSVAYTLYATKDFNQAENRQGKKCRSEWYRAANIGYIPVIGDLVMIETEARGKYQVITDIYRMS